MCRGTLFALAVLVVIAGCGSGSGTASERLSSGTLSGEYADQPFDLGYGFETFFRQVAMFAFSVASLDCTPPVADQPPTSTTATFAFPSLEVGSYTQANVLLWDPASSNQNFGSNEANVTISTVTDTSVAGSIDYFRIDQYGQTYAVAGTFDAVRCTSVPR
jgi:hypothetical protein